MKSSDLIAIRDAVDADKPFILATWLRGLRFGNDWFLTIDPKAYFKSYHDVIANIINKSHTTIKIACLKEDPNVILGYCVYNNNAIHWVFVKKAWRSIGIAKNLVPENIKTVTHITDVGKSITIKKGYTFNPFALN